MSLERKLLEHRVPTRKKQVSLLLAVLDGLNVNGAERLTFCETLVREDSFWILCDQKINLSLPRGGEEFEKLVQQTVKVRLRRSETRKKVGLIGSLIARFWVFRKKGTTLPSVIPDASVMH